MEYQLQEGTISLADGFQDRTVNMFVLGSSIPAPLSITLSRDDTLPGETLTAYVDRQVKLIAAKLRGYTPLGRKPATLSTGQPLQGFQVDAYYLNDGRPIYQRQAAFEVTPGRILVFSTTSQSDFSKRQDQDWQALLASFQPRLAPDETTADATDTE
ncbi:MULTISPECIES: DcrB-related protein [unclassified Brenneria]|uniref:DcrB-related protein n=1 Tax=unclassified Brenneria TaxID=2634434 RepID=UPI0018F0E509|nr:DUF1795 domain-containing protein [Brenneria sp. L3-3C-1]MBJ7223499.1 DUF1795 domain-containing protein [Brenneria sp. L3-3C-1]MEE3644740.1 DUF1795 domain-containing protein [Brenneria sp. L3_3C_1]